MFAIEDFSSIVIIIVVTMIKSIFIVFVFSFIDFRRFLFCILRIVGNF